MNENSKKKNESKKEKDTLKNVIKALLVGSVSISIGALIWYRIKLNNLKQIQSVNENSLIAIERIVQVVERQIIIAPAILS